MSKYFELTKHLASLDNDRWIASFSEVEDILGCSLPESARQHRPWWANQGRAQSSAWQSAGWKTAKVDLSKESVTFVYTGDGIARDADPSSPMTIADAKAGLAATFNVSEDAIEILIRG